MKLTIHGHKQHIINISKKLVLSELVHKPAKATVFNVDSIHRSNKEKTCFLLFSLLIEVDVSCFLSF